ncbi:MAG: protein arginine kinase [Acidaminococcales bacterium]|jgi:protein arginine kinase|nr:protein arginine kinase [Acidaminococcales bacterium]
MTLSRILHQRPSWLAEGREADVVLSCRVRLARNIMGVPFPAQAGEGALAAVMRVAGEAVGELSRRLERTFTWIELEKMTEIDRIVLVEKHLISPLQAGKPQMRAAIVSDDGAISVMVNEEDHFRIQVMMPGLGLENVLKIADQVDDVLEEGANFAFDEKFGYLTACPTNIGTALRATAMLHMPGLAMAKEVNNMALAAARVGLIVRGMYGEGSEVLGDIFQVSNQLAMGYSESELVESMTNMVEQIASRERLARGQLMEKHRAAVEDMAWRAYGTLSCARLLENAEAMSLYSRALLGIDLNILKIPKEIIYQLMVDTREGHILRAAGACEEPCGKEELRAKIVRGRLAEVGLK